MGKILNSNSIFTPFGDVMGLPRFHFRGLIEPGIDNPVLFPDITASGVRKIKQRPHLLEAGMCLYGACCFSRPATQASSNARALSIR